MFVKLERYKMLLLERGEDVLLVNGLIQELGYHGQTDKFKEDLAILEARISDLTLRYNQKALARIADTLEDLDADGRLRLLKILENYLHNC